MDKKWVVEFWVCLLHFLSAVKYIFVSNNEFAQAVCVLRWTFSLASKK